MAAGFTRWRLVGWCWALPWTLVGWAVGVACGARPRRVGWVVEFAGGRIGWLFDRFPVRPSAMTLGHTVLGRNREVLQAVRDHELVHVRQYERWGLLFVPAYLGCSLVAWLAGRHPYFDNPFEREAYRQAP